MRPISNFLMRLCIIATVAAEADTSVVNLSERALSLDVPITYENMKLSRAGYGMPTVKVLIPALADVTILDHRNEGESAPCLATFDARRPDVVIQGHPAIENVEFTIKLNKLLTPNKAEQTCSVTLEETVEGHIRGFKFEHQRYSNIGTRHIDDCR